MSYLGCVLKVVLDYMVQEVRFEVWGGFGCENSPDTSVLGILLVWSWSMVFPLLSIIVYYRASNTYCYLINLSSRLLIL